MGHAKVICSPIKRPNNRDYCLALNKRHKEPSKTNVSSKHLQRGNKDHEVESGEEKGCERRTHVYGLRFDSFYWLDGTNPINELIERPIANAQKHSIEDMR